MPPSPQVTTGEEGFYGCCNNAANPGQPYTEWAAEEGQVRAWRGRGLRAKLVEHEGQLEACDL